MVKFFHYVVIFAMIAAALGAINHYCEVVQARNNQLCTAAGGKVVYGNESYCGFGQGDRVHFVLSSDLATK